ncbi:MAG: TonB family protein [bacterium]
MAKTEKQLLVKIEQGGSVLHRRLSCKEKISVGLHPNNDVTVYGEAFPRQHVLFAGKNSHFQINLTGQMKGEVIAGDSRLSFRDMILHGLLPRKGGSFTYPITRGKRGVVVVGDAKITFQCTEVDAKAAKAVQGPRFIGYSWAYATFKDLGKDLAFKAILLFFIVVHALVLKYMSGLPTDLTPRVRASNVPERLAKIIVRNPESDFAPARRRGVAGGADEEASGEQEEAARRGGEEERENRRPESQGVLGLLTGLGSTGTSSNLTDFLLDKGLVRELDQVMTATDLTLGNGDGSSDELDDLFAATDLGGGIDDILEDFDEVEKVSLGEKGRIQVERIGGMTGSQSALGRRSEESVRSVMLSYTGRLTYIYNKYLRRDPGLKGKLVVEVTIAADGSVASVRLVSSSMNHPEFERDILSFIRRWKYAAIEQGTVTVTYPLFFSKVS